MTWPVDMEAIAFASSLGQRLSASAASSRVPPPIRGRPAFLDFFVIASLTLRWTAASRSAVRPAVLLTVRVLHVPEEGGNSILVRVSAENLAERRIDRFLVGFRVKLLDEQIAHSLRGRALQP